MGAIEMNEAELVLIAMDLEKQLGARAVPLHEMQIIAFYHPEEETRMLAGKAIVRRIAASGEPDEKKAALLSAIAMEGKCHMEAREDAGRALCGIIRKAGWWDRAFSVAMGNGYPGQARAVAAADFLNNSQDENRIAAVLGCREISENVREANGFMIVREALEKGNSALVARIAKERGLPQMLALYIKSITGQARQGFARENAGRKEALAAALENVRRKR